MSVEPTKAHGSTTWLGIAATAFTFAFALLGYQLARWLVDGSWTPYSLRLLFADHIPHASWKRLDAVLQLLLDFPLAFTLVALGIIFLFVFFQKKPRQRRTYGISLNEAQNERLEPRGRR